MEGIHRRPKKGGRSLEIIDVRNLSENKLSLSQSRSRAAVDPSPSTKRQAIKKPSESSKSSVKSWWKNPEMKRRRRVAKYKLYTVEGKVKNSIKKGIKWFKTRCSRIMSGF
ncbi:uncharacterized protein LOC111019023 [Momordica charantia]|uniref:Uncharacterized protein LOC111019023 n=1 Tax=Momordica charantia TaxID=3673 RepID=A0A6J1DCB3_MOMCH|nr:uncharacterized protein LOC111019023 [Momordica charantia]